MVRSRIYLSPQNRWHTRSDQTSCWRFSYAQMRRRLGAYDFGSSGSIPSRALVSSRCTSSVRLRPANSVHDNIDNWRTRHEKEMCAMRVHQGPEVWVVLVVSAYAQYRPWLARLRRGRSNARVVSATVVRPRLVASVLDKSVCDGSRLWAGPARRISIFNPACRLPAGNLIPIPAPPTGTSESHAGMGERPCGFSRPM